MAIKLTITKLQLSEPLLLGVDRPEGQPVQFHILRHAQVELQRVPYGTPSGVGEIVVNHNQLFLFKE